MSQQGTKASLSGGHTRGHQPTAQHHQAALAILTVFPPRVGREVRAPRTPAVQGMSQDSRQQATGNRQHDSCVAAEDSEMGAVGHRRLTMKYDITAVRPSAGPQTRSLTRSAAPPP